MAYVFRDFRTRSHSGKNEGPVFVPLDIFNTKHVDLREGGTHKGKHVEKNRPATHFPVSFLSQNMTYALNLFHVGSKGAYFRGINPTLNQIFDLI